MWMTCFHFCQNSRESRREKSEFITSLEEFAVEKTHSSSLRKNNEISFEENIIKKESCVIILV